jgi:beta-lactamase class A
MRSLLLLFVWLSLTPGFALAASLNTICLNTELTLLAARASGRVGVCVSDGTNGVSINGGEQFPLYNVVELPVAVAVLDAVDHGQIHLNDAITIQAKRSWFEQSKPRHVGWRQRQRNAGQ